MNKIEKQREHFESIAEKYYKSRQSGNHLVFKNLIWSYFLKNKNCLKKDNLQVLEPMCGYGECKKILEKHLNTKILYSGFDYSRSLIKKIKKIDPTTDVFEADVTKFNPVKKYDLIIIIGGLHHVPFYVNGILNKLYKALKGGGYFISFEPTHNNRLFKKIREMIYHKNSFFDGDTEQAFELAKINKLFKDQNFRIIDQIYPGLFSYILFYNPDAFPFLNIGGKNLVRFIFNIDKLFFRNIIGKKFSFATMTIFQKNNDVK